MAAWHPETEIVAFLRAELDPVTHAHVERHLRECPRCERAVRDFRRLLDDLAASAPPPPEIDWVRWTIELRARLRAAPGTSASRHPRWSWWRPVPIGLSAAMTGLLLFIAAHGVIGNGTATDLAVVDETIRAQRLDVLEQAPMLETLDLLEDLDVIGVLDGLADARQGSRGAPGEAEPTPA